MNRHQTLHLRSLAAFSAMIAIAACTGATAHQPEQTSPAMIVQTPPPSEPVAAPQDKIDTIDHIAPARDSIGPAPTLFRWTAAKGADSYSVGIWNEVDRLVWRQDHIEGTSTPRPKELELEAGTYFWTVAALSGGHQIADSGLAAFVVRTPEP